MVKHGRCLSGKVPCHKKLYEGCYLLPMTVSPFLLLGNRNYNGTQVSQMKDQTDSELEQMSQALMFTNQFTSAWTHYKGKHVPLMRLSVSQPMLLETVEISIHKDCRDKHRIILWGGFRSHF